MSVVGGVGKIGPTLKDKEVKELRTFTLLDIIYVDTL